jgi:ABC-2 type transport system permease protein
MSHTSLARPSLQSHLRAALAIAKKDVIHFFSYPLNALFRVVEPVAWLTPVYFLGRSFGGVRGNAGFAAYAGTGDYMSFVLVGSVISAFVAAVFWGMGFALKNEMDSGVLESNWLTPVPRPLFLVGQTIASIAITALNSTLMLLLANWIFGFTIGGGVLASLGVLALMLVALYGFGFAFAAIVLLLRDANAIIDISNFVVSMLSGGQFPVSVLPRFLLVVSFAIPLTYGYDAVRGLLLGSRTLLPLQTEVAILASFMVVMVALGAIVFARIERRCRQLGTLGMH